VWSKGRMARIRMEKISGIDYKIAYINRKYHSG
jgi:hypothetical protein